MSSLDHWANEAYCYLTTTGRISGRPHTIEIWFALHDATVYLLAGGRYQADWVKNAQAQPQVTVKLGDQTWPAHARIVDDAEEDAHARHVVVAKYERDGNLSAWGRTALAVALDIQTR